MGKRAMEILLVDDEAGLRDMVKELLEAEDGLSVDTASSCRGARRRLMEKEYQLAIFDVMLPDGNGFSLYRELQSGGKCGEMPVIFLSARDEDADRLRGLGLGADDYITKPFLPMELLLRVKAVLRRTARGREQEEELLLLGDTEVSFDAGSVKRPDGEQRLTAKEHALLHKLAENRGRIVTIDALCDALWPEGSYGLESSLIVHVRHLREKIEEDPSKPRYLLTVRGLGYKLEK
ncbi:response regulator transcription factor [Lachnoclostridium sp. Marseille-P6806]|uniref:response regulator transcription factor n=1 Tax=Lachnoclostridium sp. Marseille-P6806 TaxID=2364793 RepID=UPI001030AE46|nr:response regulator transcription factor [Lachnoclostridium sp. Marseille-P6806]